MVRRFCVHLLFLACIPSSVVAQHLGVGAGDLRVHVVSTTDRPLGQMMRVRLFSNSSGGSPLVEGYTDSAGEVMFNGVAPGMYHVLVSGQGYEDADSGDVEVDERRLTQRLFVRVRPVAADDGEVVLGAKGSTVDVSMLNAPKKAVQELRKGNDLMKNQEWQKAVEHLQKAVAIDPEFAAAYNNLGVAYSRVGDRAHEREALDHSLRLNDHNAAALVNRAHLALRELDLAGAALTSTRKVHMLPHRQYAIVHYFAARACEGTNHLQDAAAELRQFLQEEPHGQWSDGARKELGLLEAGSLPRTNQSPQEQAARVR